MPTRVLIADGQILLADALALSLAAWWPDLEVLEERPSSGLQAVETVLLLKPDVALLDYWLDIEGPAATRMIRARQSETKVLLLSWFHGPREVENALDSGAAGFLPKSLKVHQIAEAIRQAQAGESPVFKTDLEEMVGKIDARDNKADEVWRRLVDLTPREILVLKMLSRGEAVDDIAKELFVSNATVRKHVHNCLKKLEVHSQLEAIAIARHYGLLQT